MNYEVEIKSLLGSEEKATAFREQLVSEGASFQDKGKQKNHYFEGGTMNDLVLALEPLLNDDQNSNLANIAEHGSSFSVRTRETDTEVLLVVKASIDDTSSENGIQRREFEEALNLSLDELDTLVLNNGYHYQAKWSRERETYHLEDIVITIDKNAGYGYLTEFEIVVDNQEEVQQAEQRIKDLMAKLAIVELPQDLLARMFDHYNNNWKEYYGTDKIFTIE